jgi:hypothetical protein
LADAAKAIINGKRRDLTMQQIAEQQDLDIDPRAYDIIRLFADNPRSNKAVIEDLSDFADFTYNEATRDTTDMFGETPRATREDLVKRLENYRERRGQQNLAKRSRGQPVSGNPQEAATQPAGPDNPAQTAQAQSGLFGEPTAADRAYADREALAEAQREGQRRRNANNAPPADDGLFAQDNRQDQILFRRATEQTATDEFKQWSRNAPLVAAKDAPTHPFKTGQKVVLEAFHGTGRPDRVGTVFNPKRATSGPMAFHTSDPEIASGYAKGKMDTSLAYEDTDYANWFKYKPKGQRTAVPIDRAWFYLDAATKAKIAEMAPQVREDDEGLKIIVEPGNTNGIGNYDWEVKQARGNHLKALVESWLMSGNLFDEEEQFMTVLQKAGFPVNDVNYDSPNASFPFVYKNYIRMNNPLVVTDIPSTVTEALNAAAKRDRSRAKTGGADAWDKNTRTLRDWVESFNSGDETTRKYVWTSIPDKVTNVFREMGYDGIIDWSGKGGGTSAPVYIPFTQTQIKSATGNKGTYNDEKKDILLSRGAPTFYSQLARGFESAKQDSMPGSQWRAWLFSNQARLGIKADEIAWTCFEDFLKLKGKEKTPRPISLHSWRITG